MGLAELAALHQVVKDVYKETDFRGRVKELVEKRALKKELLNKIILEEQEFSRINE